MAYLHARLMADLAMLEDKLAGREFLLTSGPSIADISCSAYLFWLDQIGILEADLPNISRWLSTIRQLPNWQHPDLAMQSI
ncbi:MAG: hypothetical protein RL571_2694 [Pseudomonadota bacterium]|jgi:glutathione S-transferase